MSFLYNLFVAGTSNYEDDVNETTQVAKVLKQAVGLAPVVPRCGVCSQVDFVERLIGEWFGRISFLFVLEVTHVLKEWSCQLEDFEQFPRTVIKRQGGLCIEQIQLLFSSRVKDQQVHVVLILPHDFILVDRFKVDPTLQGEEL